MARSARAPSAAIPYAASLRRRFLVSLPETPRSHPSSARAPDHPSTVRRAVRATPDPDFLLYSFSLWSVSLFSSQEFPVSRRDHPPQRVRSRVLRCFREPGYPATQLSQIIYAENLKMVSLSANGLPETDSAGILPSPRDSQEAINETGISPLVLSPPRSPPARRRLLPL